MCHNVSSFAREPKLDEWVARATIFDSLTDTVSFFPVRLFLLETFYSLIPCDTVIISGKDRYGREVQWLIRFLPLCVESKHEH
jgi:hypothetical protein